jgi:hypothetical protein
MSWVDRFGDDREVVEVYRSAGVEVPGCCGHFEELTLVSLFPM